MDGSRSKLIEPHDMIDDREDEGTAKMDRYNRRYNCKISCSGIA